MAQHGLLVGAGALGSRLLGFARDAVLAWLFGASGTGDALATALRLPYMVRRLYGEGTFSLELTAACVRAGCADGSGLALARAVGRLVAWGAAGCLVVGLCAARPLMGLMAPGLADRPEVLAEAAYLFRLCLPYVPAAMLAAVNMAALHSERRFAVAALTPAVFNLTVILFAGCAAMGVGQAGVMAATGVACGGLLQWWMQIPAVHRLHRAAAAPDPMASVPGGAVALRGQAWAVARHLPLGLLSAAAPQIMFIGAAVLVSGLPQGALATLFYAERLLEFPLGVMGAAVGMAAAPHLAATVMREGPAALAAPLTRALRLSLGLNLPAAAGLMAVAVPLTQALFGHGAFDAQAVQATALALCAYAPGLPAYGMSRPLLAACHALQNTRTPLWSMVWGLGVALGAGWWLVPRWGLVGAPLGVSLGLWVYTVRLWWGCCRSMPVQAGSTGQVRRLLVQLVASGVTYALAGWIVAGAQGGHPVRTLTMAVPAGVLGYALTLLLLDAPVRQMCLRRIKALYTPGWGG